MSSETLAGILFVVIVTITIGITFWASRQNTGTADFYAAGRNFSGFQNGMAISGDYMSAASFLGISGLIALNGYDGFLYSIGFLVAWLVALFLIAELLRNSGRYTMADQLAYRMNQRPVRTAAATSTVVVSRRPRQTCGWKCSTKSPPSIALRSACSTRKRFEAATSSSGS